MSHFSVAVFTDEDTTVDDLLEPFYEGLEVEKYIALTKEDVIKRGKELIRRLQKIYKEYRKDKTAYRRKYSKNIAHLRFIKRIPIIAKWKNDRIYKEEIKYYEPDEISEDGGIYSTYNPDSKWDWFEIGGRWKDMLIINNSENAKNPIKVNSALVKDIRWDLMIEESKKHIEPYEKYIKTSFYSKEYLEKLYPTEESYIRYMTEFSTYAVLTPDGEWYEPGKMGWWGLSYATPEEERNFSENYVERFIKIANPDWKLTIVDCHI